MKAVVVCGTNHGIAGLNRSQELNELVNRDATGVEEVPLIGHCESHVQQRAARQLIRAEHIKVPVVDGA